MLPEQVERYARLGREQGFELFVMYGQTEATARMSYLPPHLAERHPDAIGVPVPGGHLRVEPVRQAGAGLPEDVGELVYTGRNVMLGYAEGPQDLALGGTVEELRTGDLGRLGDDGLWRVVGRLSRFAKVYGLRLDLDRRGGLAPGGRPRGSGGRRPGRRRPARGVPAPVPRQRAGA
jgi:acyl-CoA synthetase (AMP-forming)/AMP-acid ligase II